MTDNRVQFRLSTKKPRQEAALIKLQAANQDIKEYIISAILAYDENAGDETGEAIPTLQTSKLEEELRKVIREELQAVPIFKVPDEVARVDDAVSQEVTEQGNMAEQEDIAEQEEDMEGALGMLSAFEV